MLDFYKNEILKNKNKKVARNYLIRKALKDINKTHISLYDFDWNEIENCYVDTLDYYSENKVYKKTNATINLSNEEIELIEKLRMYIFEKYERNLYFAGTVKLIFKNAILINLNKIYLKED